MYLPELLIQMEGAEGPDGDLRFNTEGRAVRLFRKEHGGNPPLLQQICQSAFPHGAGLGQEHTLHLSAAEKFHGHLRGKMVGMGMGEEEIVHLFKGWLPCCQLPPGFRSQVAEGMSLPAVNAVQQKRDAVIFQQQSRV